MDARTRRAMAIVLAAVAALAFVGAVATVLLAPDATPTLLLVFLGVLLAVVAGELVVAFAGRREPY
jgi:hypothetical protein